MSVYLLKIDLMRSCEQRCPKKCNPCQDDVVFPTMSLNTLPAENKEENLGFVKAKKGGSVCKTLMLENTTQRIGSLQKHFFFQIL